MDIKLSRKQFLPDGIFGEFSDESGSVIATTLEHAYDDGQGGWIPKVAAGVYTCVRHAPNRLPYETFMLENVPPFQGKPVDGILIHVLNFNHESEGCIGIGKSFTVLPSGTHCLVKSRAAFDDFMNLQSGIGAFKLTIA